MASAKLIGTTLANAGRALVGGTAAPHSTILDNSDVVIIGDAVKTGADGNLTTASVTTAAIAGIVVAVCNANGSPATPDAATLDTYTMASDNETVAKRYALIDESPFTIYSFKSSAAPGTTTGSNLRNYYASFADATQLDESTAATTNAVIRLLGVDPLASTTRILGTINKPEALRN